MIATENRIAHAGQRTRIGKSWAVADTIWIQISISVLFLLISGLNPRPVMAQGVTYEVKPGDSLGLIALSHGTTVNAIVQANGLPNPNFIWVGQTLTIPVQDSGSESADSTSSRKVYTVKLGDTLSSIAQRQGITLTALINANGITNPNVLWVGQKLLIPGPPDSSSLPASGTTQVHYTVRSGDTLGRIAQQYDTTAAAIARANRITSPDLIYIGMDLVVPSSQWTPPSYPGQATRFVVSISQQRCWLYRGNTITADWPCSTGQPGAGTQPGTYHVQSKMAAAYGSTWNIWMPYWLGIYWAGSSENGIHGIPYNADTGWRLWEGYVGTTVTFGCILLSDANAKMLYDLAYIGMPVIVQP